MDPLYTTHDIAKLIQVDASTVSKWIDKGMLTAFRTPGGHRRVRASDLKAFCAAYQMPIPAELGATEKPSVYCVAGSEAGLKKLRQLFAPLSGKVAFNGTASRVDAILHLAENPPQLLLVDADDDGEAYELCAQLRKRQAYAQTRIVLVLERNKPSAHERAEKAGADALLVQPIDPASLVASLSTRRKAA